MRALALALLVTACGAKQAPPPVCPEPLPMISAEELAAARSHEPVAGRYVRLDELFDLYERNNTAQDAADQQATLEALDELRALDERMCACADKACAVTVWAELEAWADRHVKTKTGKAEADEAGRLIEHLQGCMVEVTK